MAANNDNVVTPDEKSAIETILEALSPEERRKMPDEEMPLRHFRAEKGNTKSAIEKVKAALLWRENFEVDEIMKACTGNPPNKYTDIIKEENSTGKVYVRGYDREGRAILHMRPARENTKDHINQMKHLVWNLEKAIACSAKNGQSKVCIMIDYEGFALRHSPPMSTSRYTLDILQKHYPERLYRAYICHPPFVFRTFWALVKPFIDPVTKQKIVFCSGKKGFESLAKDIDTTENVEECAGGSEGQFQPENSKDYLLLPLKISFGEVKTQRT